MQLYFGDEEKKIKFPFLHYMLPFDPQWGWQMGKILALFSSSHAGEQIHLAFPSLFPFKRTSSFLGIYIYR